MGLGTEMQNSCLPTAIRLRLSVKFNSCLCSNRKVLAISRKHSIRYSNTSYIK